jgi:sterol desaturase/sphingolipid hydroxylase (fatty acid hydroxylase superfamily)
MYAILGPVILALIAVEFLYCLFKRNGYYSFQDSLMGIGTMIISQCFNLAIAGLVLSSYGWVHESFGIFEIPTNLWTLAGCYLGVDFLFYWFHRAGHRINLLWAAHATHHSAEELNYAVALRTSITQRLASFAFYWPLAVIGFSPDVILPVVALNLIIQFLPHTRVIPRFPRWIDFWLNTPYHHRIHHAANPIYWDRNYSGSFIIWDRLFGTYRDQTEEPYYGITVHPRSWDPTWLNAHWLAVLWNDAKQATHWVDKIKLWFMPPGWRPRNLPPYAKTPAKSAANQIKYQTVALPGSRGYLLFQLVVNMSLMFFVISNRSPLDPAGKILVSLLLWAAVTLWAGILESKAWARPAEAARIVLTTLVVGVLLRHFGLWEPWGVVLGAVSLLSMAYLWLGVGAPSVEASGANQKAKNDPDYRADWEKEDPTVLDRLEGQLRGSASTAIQAAPMQTL